MKFILNKKIFGLLTILLMLNLAYSQRLKQPANIISLSTTQGQSLLKNSPNIYSKEYWKLAEFFTTEYGTSFCGPASAVMVLNAMGVEAELSVSHQPYTIFDQTNIFYNKKLIKESITPTRVYAKGLPINAVAEIINAQSNKIKASIFRATKFKNISDFRDFLIKNIIKDNYIIINFNRADLGQQGGGHFSPIAAYSKKDDRWLIMDVARYKYPPAWIKTKDLYNAIQNNDSETNKPRGIIIIQKLKAIQ